MKNAIGREGLDRPFQGAWANRQERPFRPVKTDQSRHPAFGLSLGDVLDRLGLRDGMTLSFHHHLRNGDYVLDRVMRAIHARGVKNLTIAATSIFPCHEILCDLFDDGTVTRVLSAYIQGPVARAVSEGRCRDQCILTTHGGRPRAILEGDWPIDVAFIAAPGVDRNGNLTGSDGPSACGVLGYAVADAHMAGTVVAITDYVADTVNRPEIDHHLVDYVVQVDAIGDPGGIVSGSTVITKDPVGLKIARDVATLIAHSGLLKDGFSFQTGAGGISLAVAEEVRKRMLENGIRGGFACGGSTDYLVRMLAEGLFEKLYDVQCFNLAAVESIRSRENHIKIDAHTYANIHNPDAIVNSLDVVVLGASEIDLDFNVNVTTGTDGVILGGSGGHADTAAGAKLAIIASKLVNARVSSVVDQVTTVTTPGETIDALVTDRGIAIHPRHSELIHKLQTETNLEIMPIEELRRQAVYLTGIPAKQDKNGRIVAVSEYRDGTVLDVIRQVPGTKSEVASATSVSVPGIKLIDSVRA